MRTAAIQTVAVSEPIVRLSQSAPVADPLAALMMTVASCRGGAADAARLSCAGVIGSSLIQ